MDRGESSKSGDRFSFFRHPPWTVRNNDTNASAAPIHSRGGSSFAGHPSQLLLDLRGSSSYIIKETKLVALRTLIPCHKIGVVLGNCGGTLKKLSDDHACQLRVTEAHENHDSVVIIIAHETDSARAITALHRIYNLVYTDGVMYRTIRILARNQHACALVADIEGIMRQTDTHITIRDDDRALALPDDSVIEIFGYQSGMPKAVEIVAQRLCSFLCDSSMVSLYFVSPDAGLNKYWRKRQGLYAVTTADFSADGVTDYLHGQLHVLTFLDSLLRINYPEIDSIVRVSAADGSAHITITGPRGKVDEAKRFGQRILWCTIA